MRSKQQEEVGFQLTRMERQLLAFLKGNPGRCFSRPYLLKTIWGCSHETKTRTVDVHVSRLRKKLRGQCGFLIQTVMGQGYVLLEQDPETDDP